ncbi:MAG: DUF1080 domain-containing protein [Kiritimatiellaeota bacterium]|nr:DUF1080 domain-containing protein [Kiritimatiellota bacterium]
MDTKRMIAVIGMACVCVCGAGAAEPVKLFNGKDLSGWKVVDYEDGGAVKVLPDGTVSCAAGKPLSGIAYTNPVPTMSYELKLEIMRVEGSDFFAGLTIPVGEDFCTVIIGGWGGNLCGVSSVNYMDASESQWSRAVSFENNHWHTLRVRVMPNVLQVFLDEKEKTYHARIEYEKTSQFSLRAGSDIDKTKPLGLATYQTHAQWRNFTLTKITEPTDDDKPKAEEF